MGNGDTELRVRDRYERWIEPGSAVFGPGDPVDAFYLIQSGGVELVRDAGTGPRRIARLGPGDFVAGFEGEAGDGRSRAVAVTHTSVLELDGATLEAMCVEQPEIPIRIIRELVARLVERERQLAALGADELRLALVRTLVRHAEPAGDGGLRFPIDLKTLAAESGLSMREAHRALHQLLDRRAIDLVDDCLVAPDLDSLAAGLEADLPATPA